jgi:phosphate:Na+ symporter
MLLWPLTPRLARFLASRFRSVEEIEGRPRYLDSTVLVSPALALNALYLELTHLGVIVRQMVRGAVSMQLTGKETQEADQATVQALVLEIEHFTAQLGSATLPQDIATELRDVLHACQYYSTAAELSVLFAANQGQIHALSNDELMVGVSRLKSDLVALAGACDTQAPTFTLAECEQRLFSLTEEYRAIKENVLTAGVHQRVKIRDMTLTSEQLTRMSRLAEQLVKAARMMVHIRAIATLTEGQEKIRPGATDEPAVQQ